MSSRPVVLVTGAARRVGRAIALDLAAQGYDVAVHYHRSNEGPLMTKEMSAKDGRWTMTAAVCPLDRLQKVGGDNEGAAEVEAETETVVAGVEEGEVVPIEQTTSTTGEAAEKTHYLGPTMIEVVTLIDKTTTTATTAIVTTTRIIFIAIAMRDTIVAPDLATAIAKSMTLNAV